MYLSKLVLDVRSSEVRQALKSCQDMHVNVMQGFELPISTAENRKQAGVLYRLYETKTEKILYVQSQMQPTWERAVNSGIKSYDVKDISTLLNNFVVGSILKFNILCSPYQYIDDKKRFLRTPETRAAWLSRKGIEHGFEVLYVTEKATSNVMGVKRNDSAGFGCVEFEGVLRITDVEKFKQLYQDGLGPRKAYGLGMFMLTKV